MRVTNRLLIDTVLDNLQRSTDRLLKRQTQVSSGKQLSRPSDDPVRIGRALTLRSSKAVTEQHLQNVDQAKSWLDSTDGALQQVTSLLQRLRELTVQGANGTLSTQDRVSAAVEVRQLLLYAIQVSNNKQGDQYVFAGFQTKTQPFAMNATNDGVVYSGDANSIQRVISPGVTVSVNIPGGNVFPDLFNLVLNIENDLKTQNVTSLAQTRLSELSSVTDTFTNALAEVGAKQVRISVTADRLESQRLTLTELQSKTEDLDLAEAIMDLTAQENVYNAALQTGARVIQPKLFDFLR